MPKIPLSGVPGLVQHVSDAVHMQGAPGMNFGMQDAAAVGSIGENVASVFRSSNELVGTLRKFKQEKEDVENKLAAIEAQNLFTAMNDKLEGYMTANPAAYKEFGNLAKKAGEEYCTAVAPILERMTPDARKLFEAEMNGKMIKSAGRIRDIGTQAEVTAKYNLGVAQYQDALRRGDAAAAEKIVDDLKGTLFSPEQAEKMKIVIPGTIEFNTVNAQIAANDFAPMEELEKARQGKDSIYKNLSPEQRETLLRFGQQKKNQLERDTDYAALASYAEGKAPESFEEIRAKHDNGTYSDEQFVRYMGWRKKFEEDTLRQKTTDQSRQENLAKATATQSLDRLMVTRVFNPINGKIIPQNDNDWMAIYREVNKLAGAHYGLAWEYTRKLQSAQKEQETSRREAGKASSGKAPSSGDKAVMEAARKEVFAYIGKFYKNKDLYMDPDGLGNKKTDKAFQTQQYIELLNLGTQLLNEGNDIEPIFKKIDEAKAMLNDGQITSILQYGQAAANAAPEEATKKPAPAKDAASAMKNKVTLAEDEVLMQDKNGRLIIFRKNGEFVKYVD